MSSDPDYWFKEIKRLENALAAAKWMWREVQKKEESKHVK